MPDTAPVVSAGDRRPHTYQDDVVRLFARRTPLAAAVFALTAAIGYAVDAVLFPERIAAIAFVFGVQLALCLVTTGLVLAAPRWSRRVVCITGPLLATSIGIYHALVGAPLEVCALALSLYLGGAAVLLPGGVGVQIALCIGALAAYATSSLTYTATTVPPAFSAFALGAVMLVTTIGAFLLVRGHRNALQRAAELERARTLLEGEHARAAALLDTAGALASTLGDFDALAATVADQLCTLLGADWAVLWHRPDGEPAFRVAAVSGLPPALATAVLTHRFDPEKEPVIYERVTRQPLALLDARDAQRVLPVAAVAPVLARAVAYPVTHERRVVALLFGCFATARATAAAPTEQLLAGIAHQVGAALQNSRLVDEAQSANRAKSEFIATLSHEIRTPINVVMGYADLLSEGAFGAAPQEQLDVLNRIRHQSAQLLDLIQPMLDLSRLEARQTALANETFRIDELFEDLQLGVPAAWCKPGVFLLWQAPVGPDVMMHSDRAKIEMVVRNLIHNALKYTDQGEVSVLIDSEAVPGRVQIVVRDSGTGIAAEDLPTLFEMFRQSSADLPRGGGVGLGLYIVKRLTAVLGGRVEVQSQRGVGSTFTVDLPLNAPSPAD
jgi:signal transduction histidine kinase